MYAFREINHLHSKEVEGGKKREGEKENCPKPGSQDSSDAEVFQEPHAHLFFTQHKTHFDFIIRVMQYMSLHWSNFHFIPLLANKQPL